MSDPFRSFFQRRMQLGNGGNGQGQAEEEAAAAAERQRIQVAACALLLEIAYADDAFSSDERMHIEAVLQRHFALDEETAKEIISLAEHERRASSDVYRFTSLIRTSYDQGQKTLLAEIMWGLVLTDGRIGRHEGTILRKIAGLLDLQPGYLAEAKNRAAVRIERGGLA
jgi:uncharacterized tellurite resistance protein B-like protein